MDMNEGTTQIKGFNILMGILLTILGLIILGGQVFTSLITVYFLGWMLIFAGIIEFFYAFYSGGVGKALFFIVMGILSAFIGLGMISNPAISSATITLLIGFYLVISGIYRSISSIIQRYEMWGWSLTGGIASFVLGVMIFNHWPSSGLWVIGLFIGIEFIINGFLLMTSATYQTSEIREPQGTQYFSGAKGGKAKKKTDEE